MCSWGWGGWGMCGPTKAKLVLQKLYLLSNPLSVWTNFSDVKLHTSLLIIFKQKRNPLRTHESLLKSEVLSETHSFKLILSTYSVHEPSSKPGSQCPQAPADGFPHGGPRCCKFEEKIEIQNFMWTPLIFKCCQIIQIKKIKTRCGPKTACLWYFCSPLI